MLTRWLLGLRKRAHDAGLHPETCTGRFCGVPSACTCPPDECHDAGRRGCYFGTADA